MDRYSFFVVLAALTIFSPGPGVLLTLSNSIRYGYKGSISGILGIALGTFAVAAVSATSLSLILSLSAIAFTIMKTIGATYLVVLGIKLWRTRDGDIIPKRDLTGHAKKRFLEGVTIQVTNPKAVFFFMSIFPQFIDYSVGQIGQFSLLVVTYSVLVVIIHMVYACLAESAGNWIRTPGCRRVVNKIGGVTFIGFGIGLATANK